MKEKKFIILNEDELPKYQGNIYWSKVEIGTIFKTEHKEYGYNEFKLEKYEDRKLYLSKDGELKNGLLSYVFYKGGIGNLIGAREYKYKIGDIVNGLKITKLVRHKTDNRKSYEYICTKCGYDCGEYYQDGVLYERNSISESNLALGRGCSCCCINPKKVMPDINSLYVTDYWMVEAGISVDDAKKNTKSSNKKVLAKCPHCGKEKEIVLNHMYMRKSIVCDCGDNIPYPEKFLSNVLTQLGVKYQTQLSKTTFEWCGNKRYDFYLPDHDCIIETHGGQHYADSIDFATSLKESQDNDEYKKDLALSNGISRYIVIDCRRSTLKWIKTEVLKSELRDIFNLTDIDWEEVGIASMSNLTKEICEFWNNQKQEVSTTDLADIFKIAPSTVWRYLKIGNECGWCSYKPDYERRKPSRGVKVEVYKEGVLIHTFQSIAKLCRDSKNILGVKMSEGAIRKAYENTEEFRGYTFKLIK